MTDTPKLTRAERKRLKALEEGRAAAKAGLRSGHPGRRAAGRALLPQVQESIRDLWQNAHAREDLTRRSLTDILRGA